MTYAPLSNSDIQGLLLKYIGQSISIGSVYLFYSQEEGEKDFDYANYSGMAAVKLHWYQREWFSAYSKFGLGLSYLGWKEKDKINFCFL